MCTVDMQQGSANPSRADALPCLPLLYVVLSRLQRGVAPGRALIVAQHLGLENQLIEAVSQAKSEGGSSVQLHPDLPIKLDTPLRKPRQRRTEPKAKGKNKSSSGTASSSTSKQKAATATAQHQHQDSVAGAAGSPQQQPPPIKMTPQLLGVPRPGGPPSVIGTVSTSILGVRGGKEQDTSTPLMSKGQASQLSEAMDVTALWLLSIMLLFPAWSTACLLWRKMIKRRWAVQESVSKVRRGISAVVKPFKQETTSAAGAAAVAATAAAAAAPAAAAPQRSAGSDSSSSCKGSKAGAAVPRQQRKPGPNIALPGSSSGPPQGSGQADSPTALFKSISAPEAALRAHLSSSGRDAAQQAAQAPAWSVADARRQGTAEAAPGVVAPQAAKAAAASGALAPPVQKQGSSAGAVTKAADKADKKPAGSSSKAGAAADTAAATAALAPAAVSAAENKQVRNKHAATAVAAAGHEQAQEGSKSKHGAVQRKSATTSNSTKAAAASVGQASPSSSTATAATAPQATTRQPQVLVRGKKADKGAATSPAQATLTPTKGSSGDSSRAADTHAGSSSSTKPKSALSAALKPGRAGPRHAAAELEVVSPSSSACGGSSSSRALGRRFSGVNSPLGSPPGSAPSPASGPSPRGSNRFTVAAAAAAAEAARSAAAASAAATASLRRTASGGAVLSPTRSPAKDLDDVLARARDQDRPHGVLAPAGSEEDAASSAAPSSNAWTPAAAAARAARAAVTPVKSQKDGDEDTECAEAASLADAGPSAAAAPAEAPAAPAAAQADEAGAAAGPYAESFTAAAAVAAGILSSPAGAAGSKLAAATLAKDSPLLPAQGSSCDAVDAAAATAYAAAVADAATSSAADAHTPHLDPPVSLLPSKLRLQLDAAPGRAAAAGAGAIPRSVSALEPKMVQDLADLVAESIAQEVARCKHTAGGSSDSPTHAAADACAAGAAAGVLRASEEGAAAAAAGDGAAAAVSTELTGLLAGSQLVHKSLGEVLATALTASKKAAAEGTSSASQLPHTSEQPAATPAGRDFFGFSSSGLFAGVAEKLGLHARHTTQQTTQQPQQQQQQGWFGSLAVSAPGPMHMQVLGGPPGLSTAAGVGPGAAAADMNGNMPASSALQGPLTLPDPPGLQRPPACAVAVSHPPGATLVPAAAMQQQQQMMHSGQQQMLMPQSQQQHMMVQPMPQQQQMVMQQQPQQVMGQPPMQVQPVQGVMVAMAPAQQPGQVVTMQPVAGPTYVQANGQLLHGQFVTIQGAGQVAGVPVMAGPVPAGTPVMVGPGGNIVSMQQVQHMQPQPQQVQLVYGGVPAHMAGGGAVHMVPQQGPGQQQHLPQQGMQYVHVQMPGGMLQNAVMQQGPRSMHASTVPVSSAGLAMHPMQQQQQQGMHGGRPLQQQQLMRAYQGQHSNSPRLSSSPAQVTILSRPPGSTPGSGMAAGQHKPVSYSTPSTTAVSSSPSNLTVLEAPAGPDAASCAVVCSPERLQKMLTGPQRHNETGVYVAWPRKSEPSTPASGGEGQAAVPAGRPSESDQMAADLEELLNQVCSRLQGWVGMAQQQRLL